QDPEGHAQGRVAGHRHLRAVIDEGPGSRHPLDLGGVKCVADLAGRGVVHWRLVYRRRLAATSAHETVDGTTSTAPGSNSTRRRPRTELPISTAFASRISLSSTSRSRTRPRSKI